MPTYDTVVPLSQASFSGKLPKKPRNKDVRTREYLTEKEVERLMKAARETGRHGYRDATLILLAYRHALRVDLPASFVLLITHISPVQSHAC